MLLRPFNLDSFQPIKYILEEITLIYILLIRCKLYAAAVISLQFTKKSSNVLVFVLWLPSSLYFGDSMRYINVNFKFCCFSSYCSRPPWTKQTQINYLKSTAEGLSFQISVVPNASKTFGTLFPCYCWLKTPEVSMYHGLFVYHDSFILSWFFFSVHS